MAETTAKIKTISHNRRFINRSVTLYRPSGAVNLRLGHAGATGTMAWADPDTKLLCVILTNRAYSVDDGRLLRLVSNTVAASAN